MRVRFAPSPTGYLHIGGLRTALYNYLLAKKHNGSFILRIEDTDQSRFVEDAEADILASLAWAGLQYDEGPVKGGPNGPYKQSERSDRYREIADVLVQSGNAYIAFDSTEEIDALKAKHTSPTNPNPRYDYSTRLEMNNSLTIGAQEVSERIQRGDEFVIRLKVEPGQSVVFNDSVRGEVTFESDAVDDQVLMKSDGLPTYHLANIVDDHDMEITHVIRGEEWLSSTPKHILLYKAMGWEAPQMAHLPLIMSPSGGKLSKRNADTLGIPVSVSQYVEAGYEPEALLNYLALLGWNPGDDREIMTLPELCEAFALEKVGSAGVQFDLQKLLWFNEHYLRAKAPSEIASAELEAVCSQFGPVTQEFLAESIALMLDRMSFSKDLIDFSYLFTAPTEFDEASVAKRWKSDSGAVLQSFCDDLAALSDWKAPSLEASLKAKLEKEGWGMGALMFPLRMALSGLPSGPDLYRLMELLGKEEVVSRLNHAVATIKTDQ